MTKKERIEKIMKAWMDYDDTKKEYEKSSKRYDYEDGEDLEEYKDMRINENW